MKEQLEQHVKRVKEHYEVCRGNEATTKSALIAPLFGILGFNMADPRECWPEYRADFGKGAKAATPVDWAFSLNSTFVFIVEAKEAGRKLKHYAEQLGMYFAKAAVKLGIYTNGAQWQFYTDLEKQNIMDKEPFLTWDILNDDPLPLDFLTILHKSKFEPQLIRAFAELGHKKNLLVEELTRLLEPSSDFITLAVKNVETRYLRASVLEEWKPILANAIHEWAKQRTLTGALQRPDTTQDDDEPDSESTETSGIKRKFWEGFLPRAAKKTSLHANISPGEYNSLGASSGMRGLQLNYVIKQKEGKVELYIDRGVEQKQVNKDIFDWLHKHKEEIEHPFGDQLSWQRLNDKRSCRIAFTATAGGWKSDESKWPDIQDNMIDAMVRLEKALTPQIGSLVKEFSSEGD